MKLLAGMVLLGMIPWSYQSGPVVVVGPKGIPPKTNWWDRCLTINPYLHGALVTPNFPENYPNLAQCDYVLRRWSPDVCLIRLRVQSFDVERGSEGGCVGDYLDLSEGLPPNSNWTRVCGAVPEGTKWELWFRSPYQTSITLRFRSDAQATRPGFFLLYQQVRYSCPNGPFPPTEKPTTTTTKRPVVSSTSAPLRGCDQVLTGMSGAVTFPPSWPVVSTQCRYTFPRPDPRVCVLYLRFLDFSVGPPAQSSVCMKDFLLLPGGTRLCGNLSGAYYYLYYPAGATSLDLIFFGSGRTSRFNIHFTQGYCTWPKKGHVWKGHPHQNAIV